jgi:hypothetical protein
MDLRKIPDLLSAVEKAQYNPRPRKWRDSQTATQDRYTTIATEAHPACWIFPRFPLGSPRRTSSSLPSRSSHTAANCDWPTGSPEPPESGPPPSAAFLRRPHLNRWLHRRALPPAVRYQNPCPGDLLHIDT